MKEKKQTLSQRISVLEKYTEDMYKAVEKFVNTFVKEQALEVKALKEELATLKTEVGALKETKDE